MAFVVVATASLAATMPAFLRHWQAPDRLWTRLEIDGHSHAAVIMTLANDVWRGDVVGWYRDFDGPRTWPPLHGVVGSVIQVIAGPDARLAILPSLLSWCGSAVLCFLLARRLAPTSDVFLRNAVGFLAAALVCTSPSHRAFGADVMLESMGGFLTLLTLWFYVRAKQDGRLGDWYGVAWSLTGLLTEKYNYWSLVALPITVVELAPYVVRQLPTVWNWAKSHGLQELRRPLTALVVLAGAIGFGGWIAGKLGVAVAGKPLREDAFFNALHVFAILLFVRLTLVFRAGGAEWLRTQPHAIRAATYGHLLPMLVWFMLPKRFGFFLKYLTMRHTENEYDGLLGGAAIYWRMIEQFYHATPWFAWAAGGAAAVALVFAVVRPRRVPAGFWVVLLVLAFAALATVAHPRKISRCLHSWIAISWVISAVGAAGLLSLLPGHAMLVAVRRGVPVLALAGLLVTAVPTLSHAGRTSEIYHGATTPSVMPLAEYFLPRVAEAKAPTFFANVPIGDFAKWTFVDRFAGRPTIACFVKRFGDERTRNLQLLETWTAKSGSDMVVFVEVDRRSPLFFDGYPQFDLFGEYLSSAASGMTKVEERRFPELGCTASIWRPTAVAAGESGVRR